MAFTFQRHMHLKTEIYHQVQGKEGKTNTSKKIDVVVIQLLAASVKREETQLHKSQC